MPGPKQTPPGTGPEQSQPWERAQRFAGPQGVAETVMSTLRAAGMHAGPSVMERTMEGLPSERFAKQIEDIGRVGRFAKQIEEMGRVSDMGLGRGVAGQLNGDLGIAKWAGAGVAPGIARDMKASLAAGAAFADHRASVMADLERVEAMRTKLAHDLDRMAGAGMAGSWPGTVPTGLVGDGHLQALKAADAMREEAKRIADMTTRALGPLQQLQRASGLEAAAAQQYLRSPLAARGFPSPDRFASVFGASSIGAAAGFAQEASMASLAARGFLASDRFASVFGASNIGAAARFAEEASMASLAARGFLASGGLASVMGESGITAAARLAEASMAPFARQLSAYGTIAVPRVGLPDGLAGLLEREQLVDTTVERFTKRWEGSALWFLLSVLSVRQIVSLALLDREGIEAVLLDALEAVVTEGAFAEALSATLEKAPHVSADQRDDLRHGIEHARHGEFARAVPPLMVGLEGAIWSVARAHTVVDEHRQLVGRPTKGAVARIEPVVRKLPAKQDYVTFVCSRVFGDVGNPVRHGEQSDRRRQALFAIVAIVGWADAFMGVRAREALGRMLREELRSRKA